METETITINIDKEAITKLRALAIQQKIKKGFLGKIISEALKEYLREQEENKIAQRQLLKMEKGYEMGKILIKHRSELHDRN